jgi:hypothetical protein
MINEVNADRLDGLRQYIESIVWANNIKPLDKEQRAEMESSHGGWWFTTDASEILKATVEILQNKLDQGDVQSLKEDLLNAFYSIAGIPQRQNGASDQNGVGVMLSMGWQQLEARCTIIITFFKKPESECLRLMVEHCKTFTESAELLVGLDRVSQIDISFPRNFFDNIQTRTQSFGTLVDKGIAPESAMDMCQLSSDTSRVIALSEDWQKKNGMTWSSFVGNQTEEIIETEIGTNTQTETVTQEAATENS